MGFRINRGIFQYQDGEEFRNKFKIAEDGSMVEVDADGNPITAYMKIGDKATNSDLLDGVTGASFLRSDAADSFTSTITMNTQQAFKPSNYGQGVYGRYDSYRYQHVWGMGQSWHMAENGTSLGNFYGLAYTHTNIGGESKSGLSHQTLFVENGTTRTAIGRGVWTDGNITATGNANISGNLDIGGAVVGTSSGVALAVGGTSTYGVSTGDNARNQLVVSANYYPHFVIAADLNNNPNHGAVISMVGTEGSAPRQWNIGISNRNPFLFSIGYNRSGDNNPHYGVGDNWSNDDNNHARLSIDRDGNTKIRGSLYVNGTKGGITTGSKVATEAYAAGAADAVNARIEEEVLPLIDTKLDAGATAVNADTVDGYHATNAGGGIPVLNSNGYWDAPSWINVRGTGIYSSTTNGAHFYPNSQSYGSWGISGTRNGWYGIHFGGDTGVALMMNESESGIHRQGSGWKYRHHGGKFYVYTGTNGGGTGYGVWHEGNDGSGSGLDADLLDGSHRHEVGNRDYTKTSFYVDGEADIYYPVLITPRGGYAFNRWSITRWYGWTAPWDPIGTGSHKGGLTFDFYWAADTAWGGNDKSIRIHQFSEQYTTMVGGIQLARTGGMIVWLRGGHAYYELQVDTAQATVDVKLEGWTDGSGTRFDPTDDVNLHRDSIWNNYPVRNGDDLYINNRAVATEQWTDDTFLRISEKAADSNLLDGLDSSGYVQTSGNQTITGTKRFSNSSIVIEGSHASISFIDNTSSADDFYLHANSNNFYVLRDKEGANIVDGGYETPHPMELQGDTNRAYFFGNMLDTAAYQPSSAFDAAGASAIVNDRIETEIIPSITSAQSAANDAQAAADLAVATADTAEARANSAREDAAAAQSTADSKLGATAKAADSEAVDGVDSSRIVFGNNASKVTSVSNANTKVNSGFYENGGGSGTNWPSSTWYNSINVRHSNQGNYHGFQVAMSYYDNLLWFRSYQGSGTFQSWAYAISSQNIGSQTVANANYATTAGSADQIDGWGFVNTGSNAPVNADSINSNGISYYNGGVSNFSGNANDGALYSQIYSSSWQHQIAGDYRSGQIALRGRNNGTWQAWRTVLDSSNFTSYAETAGRIDGEVLPQLTTNTTNIARNLTSIDGKAALSGSYGQNFYVNALYYDDWVRNHSNNNGMYWSNTGWHLYPKSSTDFYVRSGNNTECALQMYTGNTARTYIYADSSNNIGFLTASRSWALRVDNSKNTQVYNNLNVNGVISGDGSGLTNLPASTPPVEAIVEGGENSTLSSILFNPGEGSATFTLADGQTFRLAFAR